jgi:hypothetical protein
VVVVVAGCEVVVVVEGAGAGAGMTVVVSAGGFTVVWVHAETKAREAIAMDAEINFFM